MVKNDDTSRNDLLAVGVTPIVVSRAPVGKKRKNFMITNSSGGAHVITIHKGMGLAVAGYGIQLQVNENYGDATITKDSECWNGTISAVSDLAAGQISISEEFE